jgi:glycosyltransferase involved in cell wall biosynthesis
VSSDSHPIVDVLVPVLGPEDALPRVLDALPQDLVRNVILVKVGEANGTAGVAAQGKAVLLTLNEGGHGAAVLRGLEYLESLSERPSVVVILAANGTNDPADIPALLRPILKSRYDLVIGSPLLGPGHGSAMDKVERCGNIVAVQLIRMFYGYSYTDLSTFVAIRFPALVALGMTDGGAGFATELRVKALKVGLRVAEVPVASRQRPRSGAANASLKDRIDVSYKSLYQILRNATIR